MAYALILVAAIAFYVAAVFIANRFTVPLPGEAARFTPAAAPATAGETISVATWNVGYAGMGAASDFVMDLGEQKRPLSAELVDENLKTIAWQIQTFDADVVFAQEAAKPSFSTYQSDVLAGLRQALPDYGWMYGAEVETRLIPPPLRSSIGNAVFSRLDVEAAERRGLPLEPTFEYGAFRKGYRMHVVRLAGPERWVLINIHLSTFDSEEHDVRAQQVAALLRFAQAEYRAGARVVIGGDWNLRLADTEFPHNSDERFLFWVRDFPKDATPRGWRWAVDPTRPTVRGAHRPYEPGENFTLVIDGFLVSPNVAVEDVQTIDLGFRHTDHNPVVARFRAE